MSLKWLCTILSAWLCICCMALPENSVFELGLSLKDLQGNPIDFGAFEGTPILFANVASLCGFTEKGYRDLEALQKKFGEEGKLRIFGAPCDQFGNQEYSTSKKILDFASSKGATFTLLEKVDVNGKNTHPLFEFLKGDEGDVRWNFEYFLLNGEGVLVQRWRTGTDMLSTEVLQIIQSTIDQSAASNSKIEL